MGLWNYDLFDMKYFPKEVKKTPRKQCHWRTKRRTRFLNLIVYSNIDLYYIIIFIDLYDLSMSCSLFLPYMSFASFNPGKYDSMHGAWLVQNYYRNNQKYILIWCLTPGIFEQFFCLGVLMNGYIYSKSIYIYTQIYMQSWKQRGLRLSPQSLCGNSCTRADDVPKCMGCHKATVAITGRANCFHDCIYITLILLLWDLSTLCVVNHLWPLYTFIYIFIYMYILYIYTYINYIYRERYR